MQLVASLQLNTLWEMCPLGLSNSKRRRKKIPVSTVYENVLWWTFSWDWSVTTCRSWPDLSLNQVRQKRRGQFFLEWWSCLKAWAGSLVIKGAVVLKTPQKFQTLFLWFRFLLNSKVTEVLKVWSAYNIQNIPPPPFATCSQSAGWKNVTGLFLILTEKTTLTVGKLKLLSRWTLHACWHIIKHVKWVVAWGKWDSM